MKQNFSENFTSVPLKYFLLCAYVASIDKILRLVEDWALDYNSMKFWDFPDIS